VQLGIDEVLEISRRLLWGAVVPPRQAGRNILLCPLLHQIFKKILFAAMILVRYPNGSTRVFLNKAQANVGKKGIA
jgi:hypothetical protein